MKDMALTHDNNGPFVHGARLTEGQTETVYAVRVAYQDGEVEYWDASADAGSDERYRGTRDMAYRVGRDRGGVLGIDRVSRQVTITATDWVATE